MLVICSLNISAVTQTKHTNLLALNIAVSVRIPLYRYCLPACLPVWLSWWLSICLLIIIICRILLTCDVVFISRCFLIEGVSRLSSKSTDYWLRCPYLDFRLSRQNGIVARTGCCSEMLSRTDAARRIAVCVAYFSNHFLKLKYSIQYLFFKFDKLTDKI